LALQHGETILWEGRPVRHRLFRASDALLVPFSVTWFAFGAFWASSAIVDTTADGGDPPAFVALWGALFAVVGLYLVAGRFVLRAIASRRTRYVVTDRRVVIVGGVSGHQVRSAYVSDLLPPVVIERRDDSGSLAFGQFPGIGAVFRSGSSWRAWGAEPGDTLVLWDIPDVRHVRDLLSRR
jgi:hypothetical protein